MFRDGRDGKQSGTAASDELLLVALLWDGVGDQISVSIAIFTKLKTVKVVSKCLNVILGSPSTVIDTERLLVI